MYVVQNFSSQAMSKINVFDRLVWLVGLIQYKSLGYKTKLYCMPEDIKFLKENFLYRYYDEIDVTTLSQCDWLENINLKEFWFFRKIIAMENEFKLRHDFFYSDTDIIINTPLNFENCDVYTWGLENHSEESVYLDWECISTPENYIMPDYLKKYKGLIYNCGILYMKDYVLFQQWKNDMLNFARNNPCKFQHESILQSDSLMACNGEQRILTSLIDYYQLKVKVFDENPQSNGVTPKGTHFFFYRHNWRNMKVKQKLWEGNDAAQSVLLADNWILIVTLKDFIRDLLNTLLISDFKDEYCWFLQDKSVQALLQLDFLYDEIMKMY